MSVALEADAPTDAGDNSERHPPKLNSKHFAPSRKQDQMQELFQKDTLQNSTASTSHQAGSKTRCRRYFRKTPSKTQQQALRAKQEARPDAGDISERHPPKLNSKHFAPSRKQDQPRTTWRQRQRGRATPRESTRPAKNHLETETERTGHTWRERYASQEPPGDRDGEDGPHLEGTLGQPRTTWRQRQRGQATPRGER